MNGNGGGLRQRLEEITSNLDVSSHAGLIAEIDILHSISAAPSEDTLDQFNCYMFSLGVVGCFDDPFTPLGKFRLRGEFIRFLIDHGHLVEVDEGAADVAVYFDGANPRHMGKVLENGQIRSKWGIGNLYTHGLWEIPLTFGETVRYFRGTTRDEVIALFQEYE